MPYRPPEQILDALSRRSHDLLETIGQTVTESFQHAIQSNGRKPDEIRMLSAFFFYGLEALQRRFNGILGADGIRTTVCGIFCHQTPVVHYKPAVEGGHCELADVTFIVTYNQQLSMAGLGNAMMTQAKLTFDDIVKQKVQTGLYQRGLNFRYAARKAFGNKQRILPPKDAPALWFWTFDADQEQYLPSYRFHDRTRCIHPQEILPETRPHQSFEECLLNLMKGLNGRGFRRPEANAYEWSQIIFDLLRVTSKKAAGQKNVYAQEASGLRGKVAHDAISALLASDCYLIKNSFAEIFHFFDDPELEKSGFLIENNERRYSSKELEKKGTEFDGSGIKEPPRLNLRTGDDPDAEGGSFVLINFQSSEAKTSQPTYTTLSPYAYTRKITL